MGPRPSKKHSVDRIDNDGHYEPGNVRWATAHEQGSNTRKNVVLSYLGADYTMSQWADILGMRRQALDWRLKNGWTTEEILFGKPTKKYVARERQFGVLKKTRIHDIEQAVVAMATFARKG